MGEDTRMDTSEGITLMPASTPIIRIPFALDYFVSVVHVLNDTYVLKFLLAPYSSIQQHRYKARITSNSPPNMNGSNHQLSEL